MNLNMGRMRTQLIMEEQLRLVAYDDATGRPVPVITDEDGVRTLAPYRGNLTTGVGRNLDGHPLSPSEIAAVGHDGRTLPITHDQALLLLDNDLSAVQTVLDHSLQWWRFLDEIRARVMVDLCFNMGISTLLKFKNFLAEMRTGSYEHAAVELQNSLWYNQTGTRGVRLVAMIETGKDWIS